VQRPADDTGPEREYDPREVDGPTPETNPLCLSTAAQEYRDHGPGGNSLPAF
jgi:hypothetical protein